MLEVNCSPNGRPFVFEPTVVAGYGTQVRYGVTILVRCSTAIYCAVQRSHINLEFCDEHW